MFQVMSFLASVLVDQGRGESAMMSEKHDGLEARRPTCGTARAYSSYHTTTGVGNMPDP